MSRFHAALILALTAGVVGASSILLDPGSAFAAPGTAAERDLSAQERRARITIYPRNRYLPPNAKRYCDSWLEKEYRVSGTVIVPRMRCYWR